MTSNALNSKNNNIWSAKVPLQQQSSVHNYPSSMNKGEVQEDQTTLRKKQLSSNSCYKGSISNMQRKQHSDKGVVSGQKNPVKNGSHFSAKSTQNQGAQHQKLEQLKSRFKKIKTSYEQNHKLINNNIINCIDDYRERMSQRFDSQNINQFSITNEELTFSQSRQFNNEESLSFQNPTKRLEQSFKSQKKSIKNQHESIKSTSNMPSKAIPFENKENHISSANQSLSFPQNEQKYRSLSKELQNLRHNELIELLIDEIQDNEKNKHVINQQNKQSGLLKNQVKEKSQSVAKLKAQVQSKREQVHILLQTQKRNLEIIQKLKKSLSQSKNSLTNHPQISLSSYSNQQGQIQRFNSLSVDKMKKHVSTNISNERNKTQTQKQESMEKDIDYKQKHDELQKYLNDYINKVNQAYEEYKRSLTQLKESNTLLKQQNFYLTSELQESAKSQRDLQNKLTVLSGQAQRLEHALRNSKQVIKQLQEEFLITKDQNLQMKDVILTLRAELRELRSTKQQISHEFDELMQQSEKLRGQKQRLNEDLREIQERILSNTECQAQVRLMIETLGEEKENAERQLSEMTSVNKEYKIQLQTCQQKISNLESQIQKLKKNNQSLSSNLNNLQDTIQQTRKRLQILQQQNLLLQQTNQQMQKLQDQLLQENQQQKSEKNKIKSELISIMGQVKQMEHIYVTELSSNQLIKQQLAKYWQNKLRSNTIEQFEKEFSNQRYSHTPELNNSKDHAASKSSIGSKSQSSQMMTKQGSSSSVCRRHVHSDEIQNYSKTSQIQQKCIDSSSIAQGSRISQKYFSESDSSSNQQFVILRNSNKINIHHPSNAFNDSRQNHKFGCINSRKTHA